MTDIIRTFHRGGWSATIIDRNSPPRNHGVSDRLRYMVKLEHPGGLLTSWPIQYDNGQIAYDDIHAPNQTCRQVVGMAFRHIAKLKKS